MNLHNTNICFIGAGNMASALIQGLLANSVKPSNIWATDPNIDKLKELQDKTGINTTTDNIEAVCHSKVVLLAVKPQVMADVLLPLQACLTQHECLLISIAAGIELQSLQEWTYTEQAIIRCMPNTPALVLTGASALIANDKVSDEQRNLSEAILAAVGTVSWLKAEKDINAVTALSGSGPAYFFLLMEAMQESAEKMGLAPEVARELCLQTAFGSTKLARSSDVSIDELRRRVTSPGGTTEAALNQFNDDNFKEIVDKALMKAAAKSVELSEQNR